MSIKARGPSRWDPWSATSGSTTNRSSSNCCRQLKEHRLHWFRPKKVWPSSKVRLFLVRLTIFDVALRWSKNRCPRFQTLPLRCPDPASNVRQLRFPTALRARLLPSVESMASERRVLSSRLRALPWTASFASAAWRTSRTWRRTEVDSCFSQPSSAATTTETWTTSTATLWPSSSKATIQTR